MCDPCRMATSDDIFEVERILAAKKKDGELFFKVRWEGYGSEEDSWEPRDNLLSCQELVETFWLEQKKLSVKKGGRTPKFTKEGSDGSDTEDNEQKEIDPNKDTMDYPPTKRKRGRPPKIQSSNPATPNQRLLDTNTVPPHIKDSNVIVKKKRGRPAKKSVFEDEEILSRFTQPDYLLLDLDEIAPLGLTRQASKELALVSLRKKHESELWTNENAEVRKNAEPSVSDTNRKTSEDQSDPMNDNNNNESWINNSKSVSSAVDDHSSGSNTFEIIEISSQSTVEDDRYFDEDLSQVSRDGVKDCIVISSHSESDGEGESLPAGARFKSKKNFKKAGTQTPSLICKTKNSEAQSNHGKTGSEMSEPIDFVSCSNRAQKSGSSLVNIIVPRISEPETGKCLGNSFATFATDSLSFNDNLPSRQASLVNSTVRTSPMVCELTRELGVSSSLPDRTAPREILAQRKKGHEYKQQLEFKEPNENNIRAGAKRPGDLWSLRKRIAHVPREGLRTVAITSLKPTTLSGLNPEYTASHSMNVNDRITPAKTADLLPLQNKPDSPSLMDGDLIGSIIQDCGHDDQTRKPLSKDRNARGGGGKQDGNERLRQWDSGMEDISDGEDDLSDFDFDLDDYSPHSFFNDVEEVSVPDRGPSPVVEPLTISSADLKQAIREGDDMVVRRVLSVPGFDLEAVDSISGMTLLMWAAAAGQDDIVRLLLRRGAKLNTAQRGNAMTSLMHAAEQGFPETVQILLESGANINQLQTAGETALMKACKKGHEKVVEVLLKHGVDTKVQSNFDHTAAQFAQRSQHFAIHNMLWEHEKSLEATLEVALRKCLGGAGKLRHPLLMYRCIAPGEEDKMSLLFKYNPSKTPQGARVVLFCVKADFLDDEVSLSFSGDNGVRSVILNGVIQYPLVQGKRSVYLLNPELETNDLTIATHRTKSRLVVCVAYVNATTDS